MKKNLDISNHFWQKIQLILFLSAFVFTPKIYAQGDRVIQNSSAADILSTITKVVNSSDGINLSDIFPNNNVEDSTALTIGDKRFSQRTQNIINIPDMYTTIQQGIDAASQGDTVFVRSGTYNEHIVINKQITLTGEDANLTIIDGSNIGIPLTISGSQIIVENFTVQNGKNTGIMMNSTDSCLIKNNNIIENIGNYSDSKGGFGIGLYLTDSDNNIIENNKISNNTGGKGMFDGGDGYGIYMLNSMNNQILQCDIIANQGSFGPYSGGHGFGIYINESGNTKIYNCSIKYNNGYEYSSDYYDGVGVGIYINGNSSNTIIGGKRELGNIISGNSSFALANITSYNITAGCNDWGTENSFEIDMSIFDCKDDSTRGCVNYECIENLQSIISFDTDKLSVLEDAGQAVLTLTRTESSAGTVSINYAITGGTAQADADFTSIQGKVTWEDKDNADKTISIPIKDDALLEGDETIIITLSSPSEGAIIGNHAAVTLIITDNEQASFTTDYLSGTAPLTVNFKDSSPEDITTWTWDFGDGQVSDLQNPSHTYTYLGTYLVTLTVKNSAAENSTSQTITVYPGVPAGRELQVPGEYETIQNAVNAAIDGDIIKVTGGTYEGGIIIDKQITLQGDGADTVKIEGGNSDNPSDNPVIRIQGDGAVITGFTITGGYPGIVVESNNVWINGCDINRNTYMDWHTIGLGLKIIGSNCSITNNLITRNGTGDSDSGSLENGEGCGILVTGAKTRIINNTICFNSGGDGATEGNGYGIKAVEDTKIINNIIAYHNGFPEAGGISMETVPSTVSNNVIYYNNCGGCDFTTDNDYTASGDNLLVKPGFMDNGENFFYAPPPANFDFRLTPESPCIDAGMNDENFTMLDMAGNKRIYDGNGDGNSVIDIGAYEYGSSVNIIPGDINNSGTVDLADAVMGLKISTGTEVSNIFQEADVNKDGRIGMEEVIYALRISAQIIP